MAVLGGIYFSAKNGSIRSEEALANPFDSSLIVEQEAFLNIPILKDVITDTHYSRRNRQGRHVAFMARAYAEKGASIKGVACDERTAVCIDTAGKAYVFGNNPAVNGHAFFIQTNCTLSDNQPERCNPKEPLHWYGSARALWVYKIKGHPDGRHFLGSKKWRATEKSGRSHRLPIGLFLNKS
jgi:cyanophycinase-like exopeptidase